MLGRLTDFLEGDLEFFRVLVLFDVVECTGGRVLLLGVMPLLLNIFGLPCIAGGVRFFIGGLCGKDLLLRFGW